MAPRGRSDSDTNPGVGPGPLPSRSVRLVVSVFVVAYGLASAATVLPDSLGGAALHRIFSPGIRALALSQQWPMFAPNPPRADHRLVEEVAVRGGWPRNSSTGAPKTC